MENSLFALNPRKRIQYIPIETMASTGYSGKSLYSKLGIKPEMKIMLLKQPDNYSSLLEKSIHAQLCSRNEVPDFIHLFVRTEKEFNVEMKKLKPIYKKNSSLILWVSWIKKSAFRQAEGKLITDMTEDTIRTYALQHDLVDVKVCAVNEVWSGLKLVVPLKKR